MMAEKLFAERQQLLAAPLATYDVRETSNWTHLASADARFAGLDREFYSLISLKPVAPFSMDPFTSFMNSFHYLSVLVELAPRLQPMIDRKMMMKMPSLSSWRLHFYTPSAPCVKPATYDEELVVVTFNLAGSLGQLAVVWSSRIDEDVWLKNVMRVMTVSESLWSLLTFIAKDNSHWPIFQTSAMNPQYLAAQRLLARAQLADLWCVFYRRKQSPAESKLVPMLYKAHLLYAELDAILASGGSPVDAYFCAAFSQRQTSTLVSERRILTLLHALVEVFDPENPRVFRDEMTAALLRKQISEAESRKSPSTLFASQIQELRAEMEARIAAFDEETRMKFKNPVFLKGALFEQATLEDLLKIETVPDIPRVSDAPPSTSTGSGKFALLLESNALKALHDEVVNKMVSVDPDRSQSWLEAGQRKQQICEAFMAVTESSSVPSSPAAAAGTINIPEAITALFEERNELFKALERFGRIARLTFDLFKKWERDDKVTQLINEHISNLYEFTIRVFFYDSKSVSYDTIMQITRALVEKRWTDLARLLDDNFLKRLTRTDAQLVSAISALHEAQIIVRDDLSRLSRM